MIIIDSDDEKEEDETLSGFMSWHLDSEKGSFRGSLDSLM